MKFTAIMVMALLLLFSPLSWGNQVCSQPESFHYMITHPKQCGAAESIDCNMGKARGHSVAFELYCRRADHLKQVKTVAGMLMIKNDHELWLDDKKLADTTWIAFETGVPEEHSLPSVFTVNLSPYEAALSHDQDRGSVANFMHLHLVDVGVTPPFISKDPLPVLGLKHNIWRAPLLLEKLEIGRFPRGNPDNNIYIMVGVSRTERDKDGHRILCAYKYDRKTRTITKL